MNAYRSARELPKWFQVLRSYLSGLIPFFINLKSTNVGVHMYYKAPFLFSIYHNIFTGGSSLRASAHSLFIYVIDFCLFLGKHIYTKALSFDIENYKSYPGEDFPQSTCSKLYISVIQNCKCYSSIE